MRVAIDARMMGAEHARGIGRYIFELVQAIALSPELGCELTLIEREPDQSPFLGYSGVTHLQADAGWYSFKEQVVMPRVFAQAKADLVHVPHWNVPVLYRGPLCVTIHDLLLRHQANSAKASRRAQPVAMMKRLGYRYALHQAIYRSRTIFVPTQFVAQDVHRLYSGVENKTIVTGEGLTHLPTPDTRRVPTKPFLLYVGSAYPHKRLDLLIDVWSDLQRRYPELELVIAGELDVFMCEYRAEVEKRRLPRVHFLGRVSDAELAALYDAAQLFIFPSSHEGFGLPPLEALSRGCPLVSSDAMSLPEVLRDTSATFFQSGNRDAMLRVIEDLLPRTTELRRQLEDVSENIFERFVWRQVAKRTVEGYQRAFDSHVSSSTSSPHRG